MAASCWVGESVEKPARYYDNNVRKSLDLLDIASAHGVRGIVFSSTAAVYGEPEKVPIPEDHRKEPTNPYGETKLVIERALRWYASARGTGAVCLRYFNAAGAHPNGDLGEDHDPETHLLPIVLGAALDGRARVPVFGTDWPTPDGTCVRDYVHVVDLADAHVRAIDLMASSAPVHEVFNLGHEEGFSVRQVIETVGRVTGAAVEAYDAPRRAGDPAILVASADRARERLGWTPRNSDLETIVRTAWEWHRTHPKGWRSA
jgi:UDP-glucose 4-epimerase